MSHTYPRTYPATIRRWVDGDTVDLDVDLGFHMHALLRFRLQGVNTPERGEPGWAEATAYCNGLAPAGTHVMASTLKDGDKYGRWLTIIRIPDMELSVNARLLEDGMAEAWPQP